jgi:hypothetical protein
VKSVGFILMISLADDGHHLSYFISLKRALQKRIFNERFMYLYDLCCPLYIIKPKSVEIYSFLANFKSDSAEISAFLLIKIFFDTLAK